MKEKISSPPLLRVLLSTLVVSSAFGISIHSQLAASTRLEVRPQTTAVKLKKVITHKTLPSPSAAPSATPPKTTPAPSPAITHTTAPAASHAVTSPKPQPVVTPSPSSNVSGLTPSSPASSPSNSTPPTTTSYDSTNWSGYMTTSGSYSAISASWTATSPTGNGSTTSADATWIGIGGVTSSDLIQVGTQNTVSATGQVTSGAFYEMLPAVSQPIPGVSINPGDSISASLTEISSGEWTISLTDRTDNESYTNTVSYASSDSSAEWIEEDPSYSFRRLVPFDNFGSASFSDASATANGDTINLTGSNAQPITLVNQSGQAIATPSAIGSDGASFSITQS